MNKPTGEKMTYMKIGIHPDAHRDVSIIAASTNQTNRTLTEKALFEYFKRHRLDKFLAGVKPYVPEMEE